jgi:hypothetical protein
MSLKYYLLLTFVLPILVINYSYAQCPLTDPTTSNVCIFQSEAVNLTASGSTGFYNWYDSAVGDSVVGTGSNYQTPFLTSSQTFYVSATDTNTALEFDGTNDYVALNKSYNAAGVIPLLTVEAWVNTSVGGLSDVYGNWSIVDFDRSEYYNVFINGNTGEVGFSTTATSGGIDDFYSGATVNDGFWHHIVAVYDGVDKIIYVDGVEAARKNNPHSGVGLGTGTTRFGIVGDGSEAAGFNGGRNNRYYDGWVDELRIWNDVRTPSEIMNFKDTCLIGTEANLESYYNFNENGGATISDITGNGADGTLFNFNTSIAWINGAWIKCDCESNLVPAVVNIEGNLQDTILTCGDPSIVLDAGTSAASYAWSTGETTQTISVNQNGFYDVTTSGGGCNGSARIAVEGFTHSETALVFDGVNDYAAIENMYYEGSSYDELTVETWIKTTDAGDQIIASFDRSEYWRVEINGSGGGNGQVGFDLLTSSGQIDFGSVTRIDDGVWHHVACVFDNGTLNIYIDGILDATTTGGSTFGSGLTRYGLLGLGSESTTFNGATAPNDYFNGEMDEFKIWNRALSQTEIRTNMAKHISGKSNGLEAYYKFDDISNDTIFDHNTRLTNNAVMFNFGGAAQVISAAPIGDRSLYVYTGAWGGLTPNINSCDGETFTLSNMSGTPTGVHLYYVNNFPNDVSGLSGTGTYDRYFGVQKIGDPAATYTATYNYTGNPYVNTSNEATVELYRRPDNATFPWINTFGTLNIAANTIEATGQNTEFIIDYSFSSLPVDLISFQGNYVRENNHTYLTWETASETNCDYYIVSKSTNGLDFIIFDTVSGSGNTNSLSEYESFDLSPQPGITYYKLSQYDFDGSFEDIGIISISKSGESTALLYPNPVKSGSPINLKMYLETPSEAEIVVISMEGKILSKSNVQFSKGSNSLQLYFTENLSSGMYTIMIHTNNKSEKVKFTVY